MAGYHYTNAKNICEMMEIFWFGANITVVKTSRFFFCTVVLIFVSLNWIEQKDAWVEAFWHLTGGGSDRFLVENGTFFQKSPRLPFFSPHFRLGHFSVFFFVILRRGVGQVFLESWLNVLVLGLVLQGGTKLWNLFKNTNFAIIELKSKIQT